MVDFLNAFVDYFSTSFALHVNILCNADTEYSLSNSSVIHVSKFEVNDVIEAFKDVKNKITTGLNGVLVF